MTTVKARVPESLELFFVSKNDLVVMPRECVGEIQCISFSASTSDGEGGLVIQPVSLVLL